MFGARTNPLRPLGRKSNYDKFPFIAVPPGANACVTGIEQCAARLRQAIAGLQRRKTILVVECYPGVNSKALLQQLQQTLAPALSLHAPDAMLPAKAIETLVAPFLGGDDPVFGFLCDLTLPQFFDQGQLEHLRGRMAQVQDGIVLVVGCGARLVAEGDILIYADLSRWEAQKRFRRNESQNLGVENGSMSPALRYKRAFFVDWRVADRWKRPLIARWDFVLDTHNPDEPKLAEGNAIRRALRHAVTRPFRVVPFFDPAPWGGQWIKEVCALPNDAPNYGWGFDCVPEENSLLLRFANILFEIPSVNLVFDQPTALLGHAIQSRFGDEFPIRFDFLDTMRGGNLSFQVHPMTAYIRKHFGMSYTQDESYYLLDAGPDASVYLGLQENVDSAMMQRELENARSGGLPFVAEKYVNQFPARKHDHFLIPAGTVHCSGANSMVLEISATPYIFTFKMWDWSRAGLDGRPRPIHLEHGLPNIQWDRTTTWVQKNLVNHIEPLGSGDGWREERTGLHPLEFIETRRHWFTRPVPHDTSGTLNVLNLVEGEEALVESPENAFEPFPIHYAETFIIPANVGPYSIRPVETANAKPLATIKAYVRGA